MSARTARRRVNRCSKRVQDFSPISRRGSGVPGAFSVVLDMTKVQKRGQEK
jgi:hypothetical protein